MHDCNSSDKKEGDRPFPNPRAFAWHRDSWVQVPALRWVPERSILSLNDLSSSARYLFTAQGTFMQYLFPCRYSLQLWLFFHQDPWVSLLLANLWQGENSLRSDFYLISFLAFILRYLKSSGTSICAPLVYIYSYSHHFCLNCSILAECFYPLFVFLIRLRALGQELSLVIAPNTVGCGYGFLIIIDNPVFLSGR